MVKITAFKISLFTLLFLAVYYLFFLKPELELPNSLLTTKKILARHEAVLTQNRVSFVELTRLDPDSASFDLERSNLIGKILKTNEDGLKELEKNEKNPDIDKSLTSHFPHLMTETKQIYQRQNALLEKVFATKSFEEGVTILKSEESIKILTDQTNLILEYQFFLDQINKKLEELNPSEYNNL